MVDMHNHVLVGVDDGPETVEDAIKLLKQAKEEGVTSIIVTPHHLHPNWDTSFEMVQQKIEQLESHREVQSLGIKFYPGQEIRIKDQMFDDLETKNARGLNETQYILVELPSSHVPSATKQILFELQTKGYTPVIAHPERNRAIAKDLTLLYELVNRGALAQLTSTSLNGDLGKKIQKICLEMIDNHLVHFVASDAHNYETRPFLMKALYSNKKLYDYQEEIERMIKNAQALLDNSKINKQKPEEPVKTKKFLGLF